MTACFSCCHRHLYHPSLGYYGRQVLFLAAIRMGLPVSLKMVRFISSQDHNVPIAGAGVLAVHSCFCC